jgi:hypothetical protein
MLSSTSRVQHTPLRFGAIASLLVLNGCFAMVAGVHQDVHFKSDVPSVEAHMDGQTCQVPCTLTIRRQWGTFQMEATQNGEIVAQGPISRVEEYAKHDCDLTHEHGGLMIIAAFTDGLLLIPGIVDLSTGIIVWHPDTVVIEPGTYRLEDPCFEQPVVLSSEPSPPP